MTEVRIAPPHPSESCQIIAAPHPGASRPSDLTSHSVENLPHLERKTLGPGLRRDDDRLLSSIICGPRPLHHQRGNPPMIRSFPFRRLAARRLCLLSLPRAAAQNFSAVRPSPQQVAWQEMEFGVIVHFNANTWLDQEWGDGTAKPSVFNPDQVDPAQWA